MDEIIEDESVGPNTDLEIITKLGFDISTVEEFDDHYVVEGDIGFDKREIEKYESNIPETRQYKYKTTISNTKVKNIKVRIDPNLFSQDVTWTNAVYNAVSAWRHLPSCAVNFEVLASGVSTSADITISMDNSITGSTIAVANYPTGSTSPGSKIRISSHYGHLTPLEKTRVMAHEFGHTIGLVHSDWVDDPNSASGTLINGTPTRDKYSLMNYQLSYYNMVFSYYDAVAIKNLYPEIQGGPSLSVSSVGYDQEITLSLRNYTLPYDVSWFFEGDHVSLVRINSDNSAVVRVSKPQAYFNAQAWCSLNTLKWMPVAYLQVKMPEDPKLEPGPIWSVPDGQSVRFYYTGTIDPPQDPGEGGLIPAPGGIWQVQGISGGGQATFLTSGDDWAEIYFKNDERYGMSLPSQHKVTFVYKRVAYETIVNVTLPEGPIMPPPIQM